MHIDDSDPPASATQGTVKEFDPDNIPVRVVNSIIAHGFYGSQFAVTLRTVSQSQKPDGTFEDCFLVAARLGFDLGMARKIRDVLNSQIDTLEKMAKRPKPN